MKKYFLIASATILFSLEIFCQTQPNDSIMVMNRRYKNEIGIDFQGFFKGTPGTFLIWKRKKIGHLISLTFSKNYRFQLGINGTMPLTQKVTQIDTSKGYYVTSESKQFLIQPMFGIERINFFGRFNIFYGMDFGPYYSYARTGYTVFGSYNNGYYYSYFNSNAGAPNETTKYGLSLIPFIGVKYRIAEHFSASMESGFNLSYYFSNTKLLAFPYFNNYTAQATLNTVSTTSKVNGISFSMMYLRFLTFNYHF